MMKASSMVNGQFNTIPVINNATAIVKIKGLKTLTRSKTLYLSENAIKEIMGLETLKNLENLSFEDNKITKIKGLNNLINLFDLNLFGNLIRTIGGLESLIKLQRLRIGNNLILQNIISECGGLDQLGYALSPQKFVDFCKR